MTATDPIWDKILSHKGAMYKYINRYPVDVRDDLYQESILYIYDRWHVRNKQDHIASWIRYMTMECIGRRCAGILNNLGGFNDVDWDRFLVREFLFSHTRNKREEDRLWEVMNMKLRKIDKAILCSYFGAYGYKKNPMTSLIVGGSWTHKKLRNRVAESMEILRPYRRYIYNVED